MKKSTKSSDRCQPRQKRSQRWTKRGVSREHPSIREQIRASLMREIQDCVAATARQLVEDEVHRLVGAPWSRKGESPLRRGGPTRTTILLGGEPHVIERTRVRDQEQGTEHQLQTVGALKSRDAFDEEVKGLLVRGVSTRSYDGALSAIADGLGLQKSAVSTAFQRGSSCWLSPIEASSSMREGQTVPEFESRCKFFAQPQLGVVFGVRCPGADRENLRNVKGSSQSRIYRDLLSTERARW